MPRFRLRRIDPFKVADEQHAEVRRRRQRRPAHLLRIECPTLFLDETIETLRTEDLVDLLVEGMTARLRQFTGRDL